MREPEDASLQVRTAILIEQLENLVTLLHAEAARVADASDRLEQAIERSEQNYDRDRAEQKGITS